MSMVNKSLKIGDRVAISGSDVRATGIVIKVLVEDYVQVLWSDVRFLTTHRRHALIFEGSLFSDEGCAA
jgi:hypothetical protein